MTVIACLEFELAYLTVTAVPVSHLASQYDDLDKIPKTPSVVQIKTTTFKLVNDNVFVCTSYPSKALFDVRWRWKESGRYNCTSAMNMKKYT